MAEFWHPTGPHLRRGRRDHHQLRTATERLRAKLAEIDAAMSDAGKVNALGPLVDAGKG